MTKKFASHADTEEKQVSFVKLAEGLYAYTAEGDPNTGVVIGDDSVMVIDTQATPIMAEDVIRRHPRGHRQANQARGDDSLPCGAGTRRLGLQC